MPCAEMPGDSLALCPHAVSPIPSPWWLGQLGRDADFEGVEGGGGQLGSPGGFPRLGMWYHPLQHTPILPTHMGVPVLLGGGGREQVSGCLPAWCLPPRPCCPRGCPDFGVQPAPAELAPRHKLGSSSHRGCL